MNISAKVTTVEIVRPVANESILVATRPDTIAIRAGAAIDGNKFADETALILPDLTPGADYAVIIEHGTPVAHACADGIPEGAVGGFHFAPFGNAIARTGGTECAAINPFSCWDANFRPAAPDPRGMTLVNVGGGLEWQDVYILGVEHHKNGTSRYGVEIADGSNLPYKIDGSCRYSSLDFAAASEIYAAHGKTLITAEGFFAGAYGVEERRSRRKEPKLTGEPDGLPFVSRYGLIDATGTMWQWGTDGDPDDPRLSIFGGYWCSGDSAGSRDARLVSWTGGSDSALSARGRSDHLNLA